MFRYKSFDFANAQQLSVRAVKFPLALKNQETQNLSFFFKYQIMHLSLITIKLETIGHYDKVLSDSYISVSPDEGIIKIHPTDLMNVP